MVPPMVGRSLCATTGVTAGFALPNLLNTRSNNTERAQGVTHKGWDGSPVQEPEPLAKHETGALGGRRQPG